MGQPQTRQACLKGNLGSDSAAFPFGLVSQMEPIF